MNDCRKRFRETDLLGAVDVGNASSCSTEGGIDVGCVDKLSFHISGRLCEAAGWIEAIKDEFRIDGSDEADIVEWELVDVFDEEAAVDGRANRHWSEKVDFLVLRCEDWVPLDEFGDDGEIWLALDQGKGIECWNGGSRCQC